jgi:hypothetical protein
MIPTLNRSRAHTVILRQLVLRYTFMVLVNHLFLKALTASLITTNTTVARIKILPTPLAVILDVFKNYATRPQTKGFMPNMAQLPGTNPGP